MRAPVYGTFIVVGTIGSGIIGHRASTRNVTRDISRAVGIRVFSFWMSVAVAAWFIPAAAGCGKLKGAPKYPS